jgi:hypothetical protein
MLLLSSLPNKTKFLSEEEHSHKNKNVKERFTSLVDGANLISFDIIIDKS